MELNQSAHDIPSKHLLDALPDAVLLVDAEQHIAFANTEAARLLGHAADTLRGQPLSALLPERYREAHVAHFQRFFAAPRATSMGQRPILYVLSADRVEIPVTISISALDCAGKRYALAVLRDALRMREHLNDALDRAELDPLTGVGNRVRLERHGQRVVSEQRPFTVLYLDLNRFKQLNDRYGHRVGDQLLRTVAQRLSAAVRNCDLVTRMGGDEFVVLLDDIGEPRQIEHHAHRLADSIEQPIHVGQLNLVISAALGGAMFPAHADTLTSVVAMADKAMYRAKRLGAAFELARPGDDEPDSTIRDCA